MRHEDKLQHLALRAMRAESLCERQEEKLCTLHFLLVAIDMAVRRSDPEAMVLITRALATIQEYVSQGNPAPATSDAPLGLIPNNVVRLPTKPKK